jgi:hypothetical protein
MILTFEEEPTTKEGTNIPHLLWSHVLTTLPDLTTDLEPSIIGIDDLSAALMDTTKTFEFQRCQCHGRLFYQEGVELRRGIIEDMLTALR